MIATCLAGIGTITSLFAKEPAVQHITALEPAANLFPRLSIAVTDQPRITPVQATTADLVHDGRSGSFDAITYVSVLEHIEHDEAELRVAAALLTEGGRVGVFVPAGPWLYGSMDQVSGHHRRYTKASIRVVAESAGFVVEQLYYADVAGALPYWFVYRVLKHKHLGDGSATLFDGVLVPISMFLQRLVAHPPLGKNLVLIARKR